MGFRGIVRLASIGLASLCACSSAPNWNPQLRLIIDADESSALSGLALRVRAWPLDSDEEIDESRVAFDRTATLTLSSPDVTFPTTMTLEGETDWDGPVRIQADLLGTEDVLNSIVAIAALPDRDEDAEVELTFEADCLEISCGDGALTSEPMSCRNGECAPAPRFFLGSYCGDGMEDSDEDCDHGRLNSNVTPDACRIDCEWASCGDGVIDEGELCDDYDNVDSRCSDDCQSGVCTIPGEMHESLYWALDDTRCTSVELSGSESYTGGPIAIDRDVVITGPANIYAGFLIQATVRFEDVTFDDASENEDGILVVDGGELELVDVTCKNNEVSCVFGAAFGSQITVSGSTFEHNSESAIVAYPGVSLQVSASTFVGNQAGAGGAINAVAGAEVQVLSSTFRENTATNGGAVSGGGVFQDCTFEDNTAEAAGGSGRGGAFYQSGIPLSLTGCTFDGNRAVGNTTGIYGGAVYVTGELEVSESTFVGNSSVVEVLFEDDPVSAGGSALYIDRCDAPLTLTNTVVRGNVIDAEAVSGGAIEINDCAWGVEIYNSSILENDSGSAPVGSLYLPNPGSTWVRLQNSILWTSAGPICSTTAGTEVRSAGYNLWGNDQSGCTITGPDGAGGDPSTGDMMGDPMLILVADNIPVPMAGSPAVNTGNPSGCYAGSNPVTIDLRGVARPVGERCDIGAVERQPADP